MLKRILKKPELSAMSWATVIFILCATPGRYIPSASWLEILSVDKFVHAGIFFVLCSLCFLIVIKRNQANTFLYIYLLAGIIYGALLEFMQANYFSERSADWQDIVANSTGCLLALTLVNKLKKRYEEIR
jgi:VanZ family protein